MTKATDSVSLIIYPYFEVISENCRERCIQKVERINGLKCNPLEKHVEDQS